MFGFTLLTLIAFLVGFTFILNRTFKRFKTASEDGRNPVLNVPVVLLQSTMFGLYAAIPVLILMYLSFLATPWNFTG